MDARNSVEDAFRRVVEQQSAQQRSAVHRVDPADIALERTQPIDLTEFLRDWSHPRP